MDLKKMYATRFAPEDLPAKNAIWRAICSSYLSRFIAPQDTVVDVGAGYCEFINNIDCANKIAIDLNEDVKRFANPDVRVINESCMAITSLANDSVDVVFMSNFLEHLLNKQQVFDTLVECHRILKPGGRLIILQPNIRFLPGSYWDFFDHHTPLTDRSLVEVLQSLGLRIQVCHPKFLPYTTKSRLPKAVALVTLYLRIPLAWKLLGKQALIVAEKSS
jgi:ubiquinone/menaquinone biosynthesis C-methylase UbiE